MDPEARPPLKFAGRAGQKGRQSRKVSAFLLLAGPCVSSRSGAAGAEGRGLTPQPFSKHVSPGVTGREPASNGPAEGGVSLLNLVS